MLWPNCCSLSPISDVMLIQRMLFFSDPRLLACFTFHTFSEKNWIREPGKWWG